MGVKIIASVGLNMDALNFNNLTYGATTVATTTKYQLSYGNGLRDVFTGTGFIYDDNLLPLAGTVKSVTEYYGSTKWFSITGMNTSAGSVVVAAFSPGLNDDAALMLEILKGKDTVIGSEYDDFLFAAAGNDVIKGRGGNDVILAGPGADDFYGGSGADLFVFVERVQSTVSAKGRDTIFDFKSNDRIDVSALDANLKAGGDQSFKFVGTKVFSGHAGELRYTKKDSDTLIYGDVNGDKKADFSIHLDDAVTMKAGYFFL